ncbi:VWA-like domain-containing protein [uncultured Allobaculum sp.]|uniref:vWA domain-containing protein n=1 Tax=uncultured Allobaculum sp. TaxID=1187017 RepID=UPI0026EDDC50|nr:VWA-like domain-containing protein [uncultured Allobaculum sp.]
METADREALKKQRMRVSRRLTLARRSLLGKTPFYGRLLLRTPFAFAPCKTAMTNMEQILFDPEFVDEIDDEQLEFVLLHEILHCALGHPLRAGTMNFDLFQIACDIVVNSVALEELHLHTILFENQPVMCIAPDGLPGRVHTAEEVYKQLLDQLPKDFDSQSSSDSGLTPEDEDSQTEQTGRAGKSDNEESQKGTSDEMDQTIDRNNQTEDDQPEDDQAVQNESRPEENSSSKEESEEDEEDSSSDPKQNVSSSILSVRKPNLGNRKESNLQNSNPELSNSSRKSEIQEELEEEEPSALQPFQHNTPEIPSEVESTTRKPVMHQNDPFMEVFDHPAVDSHDAWKEIEDFSSLEIQWSKAIEEEAELARQTGSLPGTMERYIKALEDEGKVDWLTILSQLFHHNIADYSFSRPDRRMKGPAILPGYLDDLSGNAVENIWVVVDVSGSVFEWELEEFINEIRSMIQQIDSVEGYISFFDIFLSRPIPFSKYEDIEFLSVRGGGGTSFEPIFDRMNELFEQLPAMILIFTDGYAQFPPEEMAQGIPVVWLITSPTIEAPWGYTLHLDLLQTQALLDAL